MRPVEELVADLRTLATEIESGVYDAITVDINFAIEEKQVSRFVTESQQVGKIINLQLRRRQDGEAQEQN